MRELILSIIFFMFTISVIIWFVRNKRRNENCYDDLRLQPPNENIKIVAVLEEKDIEKLRVLFSEKNIACSIKYEGFFGLHHGLILWSSPIKTVTLTLHRSEEANVRALIQQFQPTQRK
jgi:hypothetical protein